MSNLTAIEREYFEKLFGMSSGYVMDFSNRQFKDFFSDHSIDIFSEKYSCNGDSKANRMRAFWKKEPNEIVVEVTNILIEYGEKNEKFSDNMVLNECKTILNKMIKESPNEVSIHAVLSDFSADTIHEQWQKALNRKNNDHDGAITIARTLLESVCKHILDEKGVSYEKTYDLPLLYKKMANTINLDCKQHESDDIKKILSGCARIVHGLAELRNDKGDAHGKGRNYKLRPAGRHSELAVNLAGSMSLFLIQTYLNNVEKS